MWSSQPCEGELLYRCPVLSHEIVGASSEGSDNDADLIDACIGAGLPLPWSPGPCTSVRRSNLGLAPIMHQATFRDGGPQMAIWRGGRIVG